MLLRVFFWLAGILAVLFSVFDIALLPFVLLIWFGLFVGITCGAIFFLFICSLFCYGNKPFEKDNPILRNLAYHTMDSILEFFRFCVQGENIEKIPQEHIWAYDRDELTEIVKNIDFNNISKQESLLCSIVQLFAFY
ncbi:MAG: hypothetical protein IKU24_04255, partial [Clostridia bacterium]|nr:hypothetical protein [Clostridia bacterium]